MTLDRAHEANDEAGPTGDAPSARAPATARGRLAGWLYAAAAAVYVADRVTKVVADHVLRGHPPRTLVPGVLQLQYTTNKGGAFGLFDGATWLFLTATLVVSAVIVIASFNLPGRSLAVGLGLVLGGALGNLTDRLIRGGGLNGRVVDFLAFARTPSSLPVWPVFNLADSAIVVGAGLIVLSGLWRSTRGHR